MARFLGQTQIVLHAILLLIAFLFVAPLIWMVTTSLKAPEDIINGLGAMRWLPHPATLANFHQVLTNVQEFPVWRWTGNSLFISLATTLLIVVVDSLAAFSYSRLSWKGRDKIFAMLVATMMVPGQVLLIPTYLLIRNLQWFDTYWALIIPAASSAFGVFLLRQFFMTIPKELEEAARLDGCGPLGVFRHVILPLSKPAIATLAIFTFMGTWNAFEGPLIFTNSQEMRTLPIGITIFQGHYNAEYGPLMAAATLAAIPILIAFLMFQKHIIKGISLTGLAGR
ncbi:sugar ABC transporter permease [Capsulimonas corticalis]|uniref:Sugar ABC transporter permease n=1 Tax=Capsulimonas corticalis TaxID=2219043 RepID=A0A402CZ03_9BACT|nr:carbohydrate ABC transporter permease [Capsulimonas corticalis]BDI29557.1 sugar ABC transporter permease [Capsulimonas corticalis]